MRVPDLLKEKAKLFEEKGRRYGNSYKEFGSIMEQLMDGIFPAEKWNRIGIYSMLVHKMMRLGKTLFDKNAALDSVMDMQVYAAMLEELIREETKEEITGVYND